MRAPYLGFVVGAAVALQGCASLHPAPQSSKDGLPAGACADWRWIGITNSPDTACPAAPWGWKPVRPLFQPAAKGQECVPGYDERKAAYADGQGQEQGQGQEKKEPREIATADVVAELKRFCVYESSPSWWKRSTRPPFSSPQHRGLARLDRDCAGISIAAAEDLTPADLEAFSYKFFAEAGQASAMTINNQQGVRLAFLDTEPTGKGVPRRRSEKPYHGYTMAHLAKRLVCSPEAPDDCAAQITTRLAMPLLKFDSGSESGTTTDVNNGGGFGTQMDLADAIYGEVNDWLADRQRVDPEQHLVLNLSLGWDPHQFGDLGKASIANLQAGTQAVYRALQYAKSLDVLVVAAAGNKRDCCPQSSGMLLPAAWEAGTPSDDADRDGSETPLLYAVGGVDAYGNPLVNAREEGIPKLVAYGENAVATSWNPATKEFSSTWLYTGSSVATAVVSSAAALVWDSFPNLRPDEVMQELEASATPLTVGANFSLAAPPVTRRIRVCEALRHACTGGGTCPIPPTASCGGPVIASLATGTHPEVTPVPQACHAWVVPQPDDPPCLPCGGPPR